MADRLVELQDDLRRQERQAMFSRVVAGLVHVLSHPIMNLGNVCKLLMREWDSLEMRDLFVRTVDRELKIMRQLLDDLRHLARPQPLQKYAIEINRSLSDTIESMRPQADNSKLTLRAELSPRPLFIDGEPLALARVYRNLIQNDHRGDAGRRLGRRGNRGNRRTGPDSRLRHGEGHLEGPAADDLRRLRHHQAPRSRAGSRGKTDLPLDRFHIPLIVYAPKHLAPPRIDTIASQIDVGPTVLALLNMNYVSRFFGQDILNEGRTHQRAVMANYQTVGYYEHGLLIELRPQRRVRVVDVSSGREAPATDETRHYTNEAIGYYQGASTAFRTGALRAPGRLVQRPIN